MDTIPREGEGLRGALLIALAIVAIVGIGAWLLSRHESSADRCRRVSMEEILKDPPPKPSDASWYAENCWAGRPRQ